MIVLVKKEGQLANRIWQLSAFILNARKHHYKICHLCFEDYFDVFSESIERNTDLPVRFVQNKWLRKKCLNLFEKLERWGISNKLCFSHISYYSYLENEEGGEKIFDLESKDYLLKARKKILFMQGWFFGENFRKSDDTNYLRKIWTPNAVYLSEVSATLLQARQVGDLTVGVHIRRGDYATYNNGAWFYKFATYANFLQQFSTLPAFKDSRICFILCCNENVPLQEFDDFQVISESRHFITDMYLLAGCDFIIAPPSSYSMWASFYGQKPLFLAASASQKIDLTEFRVIDTFPYTTPD